MKIRCESCQTKLNVPDDKIEHGADFSFTCPKCKTKNTVRIPDADTPEAAKTLGPRPAPKPSGIHDLDEDATLGEFFEEGAKPAMICFDDVAIREKLMEIVEDLGMVPVIPTSTRDALNRLKVSKYNAVLLHENYDGQTVETSAVMRMLLAMDMNVRRRIYVVLFGERFHSLDQMTAYSLSVNAVIGMEDESSFDKILYRGLAEYERFYRVYFDVMREMGKI